MPVIGRIVRLATMGLLASAFAAGSGCQFSVSFGPKFKGRVPEPSGFSQAAYRSNWGVMGTPHGTPYQWEGGPPPSGPYGYGYNNMPPQQMGPYSDPRMMRQQQVEGIDDTELPAPRVVPNGQ